MDAKTFAQACKEQRDIMLATYADPSSGTDVACLIAEAALTPEQTGQVLAALHSGLTDAFYTLLLALDGAAPLGNHQQVYTVRDDVGNIVAPGDGRLEAAAGDALHSAPYKDRRPERERHPCIRSPGSRRSPPPVRCRGG